jgi:hypothetical protein
VTKDGLRFGVTELGFPTDPEVSEQGAVAGGLRTLVVDAEHDLRFGLAVIDGVPLRNRPALRSTRGADARRSNQLGGAVGREFIEDTSEDWFGGLEIDGAVDARASETLAWDALGEGNETGMAEVLAL